jgi:hypothetical protein
MARPPKFNTPEEMQELIDAYFADRDTTDKPYTVTGLALALDTTRETLMDYQNKPGFSDTVKKAKARVEAYAEERLYYANAAGAIFALKNFGWSDKQELNLGGQEDNPIRNKVTIELVRANTGSV